MSGRVLVAYGSKHGSTAEIANAIATTLGHGGCCQHAQAVGSSPSPRRRHRAGGLGPEIVRSEQALVSNQLNAMSAQLTARGIEPRLIPSTQQALQSVLTSIRQPPIDGRDAAAKLSASLAAMRLAIQQTIARASLAGRARLIAALLGIEQALVTSAPGSRHQSLSTSASCTRPWERPM